MLEQGVGGAVELGKRNEIISRFRDVVHRIFDRGHARADAERLHAAFQRSDAFFQHGIGRIADSAVDVTRRHRY